MNPNPNCRGQWAYVTNIFLCLIYPPCGEYLSLQMGFNSAPGSFFIHDTYVLILSMGPIYGPQIGVAVMI